MAKNRMPTGLVALSTTAITAIYIAGYVRTQAADATIADAQAAPSPVASVGAAPPAAPSPTSAPPVSPRRGAAAGTSRGAQPPSAPTPAPVAQAPATTQSTGAATQAQTAGYKDGTFSGHGTSRRGDVWVDVTVQGGRITSVNITRSTLQYPVRDIAGLPAEVVQRQSAQVDTVSRATYSSQAFRGAVSQALAQAVQA